MNNEVFMEFLKTHYPYLYDIEMEVRKIQDKTGYGDISASLTLRSNRVVGYSIGGFAQTKLIKDMTV